MSEEENQTSQTRDFVDSLASGNNAKAGEAFKGALRDRVGDTLDAKRKEHASNLFSTAQPVPTEAQDDVLDFEFKFSAAESKSFLRSIIKP